MLALEGVSVHYGRLAAVRGLDLVVSAGEIVAIAGPNGAGKSTTLLTVAGALRPSAGTISLDGEPIAGKAPEVLARRGISLVPEGRHIFAGLSVEENLRLGTHMHADGARTAADLERVFGRFGFLRDRRHQRAGKLSGGQQQQLAIARALMARPRLMLIDEPSLGLAPRIVDEVYDLVAALREEGMWATTLLVVA